MTRLLAENGMDVSRVVTLVPRANALMPRIYRNSDVGLFPNRCEGGTNLVLMEYMACGKPVVATATTGHGDIVKADNALVVGTRGVCLHGPDRPGCPWPEPSLDETVEKLEWVYQHRQEARALGNRAAGHGRLHVDGGGAAVFVAADGIVAAGRPAFWLMRRCRRGAIASGGPDRRPWPAARGV